MCFKKGSHFLSAKALRKVVILRKTPTFAVFEKNGYKIGVGISDVETIGIDTPEDLARAEEFLARIDRR